MRHNIIASETVTLLSSQSFLFDLNFSEEWKATVAMPKQINGITKVANKALSILMEANIITRAETIQPDPNVNQ